MKAKEIVDDIAKAKQNGLIKDDIDKVKKKFEVDK